MFTSQETSHLVTTCLSQGDLDTFHFEVYDSTGTNHLGYEDSQCAVGFVNQQDQTFTFDCSSDFVLPGGQIATVGHVDPSFSTSQHRHLLSAMRGNLQEHFAITGGTGQYRGASGQLDWGGSDPRGTVLLFRFDE